MQRLRLFSLFAALLLFSCGEEPGLPTSDVSDVRLSLLTLTPSRIDFSSTDTVKDTVVRVAVSIRSTSGGNLTAPQLLVVNTSNDKPIYEGPMTGAATSDQHTHVLDIATSTTSITEYAVYVFVVRGGQQVSNKVLGRIRVNGFSTGRPQLLFEDTPATVQIPSGGSQTFDLKAKVGHPNGNSLIQTVNVIIRGANGVALSGSPFQLFDNGNTANNGDLVAGDSLYTRRFVISSSNNPDTYTLRYYAIDRFGASSDTLTATMRFVP